MKKRFLSLLMTICLFICAIPMEAKAYTGNIPGVDYTRIVSNSVLETEVEFKIGSNVFTGTLSNGNRLEDDEVDEIIREFMKKYFISSEDLKQLHANEKQTFKYDEKRYVNGRVYAEILLGTAGIANGEQLSYVLNGEFEAIGGVGDHIVLVLDTIAKTGLSKMVDIGIGAMFGMPGKILSFMLNAANVSGTAAYRELMEYLASEEQLQQGFAAALALEEFYALVNARIKAKEQELTDGQWSMTCNDRVFTENILFESIVVPQCWDLYVDLVQTTIDPIDPNGWGGIYEGTMTIDISHDMANFDKEFKEKIYLSSSLPFLKSQSFFKITDQFSKRSILTKELTNHNFKIQIGYGNIKNKQINKAFSLDGFQDNSKFWSHHPVRSGADFGLYNNGDMNFSMGPVHADGEGSYVHNFTGKMAGNNMGISVELDRFDLNANVAVTVPYNSDYVDVGRSDTGAVIVATDNAVFKELLGIKEIIIKNVD